MTQFSARADAGLDVGQVLLKLDETVRFGFSGGRLVVEHLGRGLRRELPLSAVHFLAQFESWTHLTHAFSGSNQDLELPFALVRDLVDWGVLIVGGREAPSERISGDRWKAWRSALSYHLESRTTADQMYYTPDEASALLTEKARDHPWPSSFKDYPARPFYALPNPEPKGKHQAFLDVIFARRTCRSFSRAPLSTMQLSALLCFSWGCTATWRERLGDTPFLMKTSPSGGSMHSAEVYPILLNVSGLPNGIYHYSVRNHGLEMLSQEDPSEWLGTSCGDQKWASDCAAAFVMTAVVERIMWKYAEPRAYRVLLFDMGHLSQTFALVATHLGLGSFVTAALRDEVFEQKLELDYLEESVFLVTGVGVPTTRV